MLQQLSIRNIVLIESLDITFDEGFSVLTGETGAGKSILLDALSLVLGGRAESRLLRSGASDGTVTAVFSVESAHLRHMLEDGGIVSEGAIILRRMLGSGGKSKAFINDIPVSIGLLQNVGEELVEIHGQHDQKGLLDPSQHRNLLDNYGVLEKKITVVSDCYVKWKAAFSELESLQKEVRKSQEEQEYLAHVRQELEKLNPQKGEEESLAEQRTILMQQEKIAETLNNVTQILDGRSPVLEVIGDAERGLLRSSVSETGIFDAILESLDRASTEVNEALDKINETGDSLDLDGSELDAVEERLFALRAAARKHNKTADELVLYHDEVAAKLESIENSEEQLQALTEEAANCKAEYKTAANDLSERRKIVARKMEKSVEKELQQLKMAGCKLRVVIEALGESKWSANGLDKVSFEIKTNAGSPFSPLHKIASGGELSRFMLAMKVSLSFTRQVPTMIFDEIDTGVGGAVASAIGKRLTLLGGNGQVFAITHQPQVAAYGEKHLFIEKKEKSGQTYTSISRLEGNERKEEVARMLAGKTITDEARAAAEKLMVAE